jgi:outer membrane protein
MYHPVRAWASAAFALVLFAPALHAQKMAFVDSRVILDRAPGAAAIQAELDKERQANMAKVQKMQDSLKTMVDALNKDAPSLTDSVKVRRTKAIQDKQAEYSQRADDMDQAAQKHQGELVQPLMDQIREVLDKIRSEEGYTFIFDVGQSPVIVAADKNLDITERVIARLKPVSVNVSSKSDSVGKPAAAGTKPAPAGVTPVKKPPTE